MASSTRARKDGVSLAKGPVGLLGLAMLAFGALSLVMGDNSFTSDPINGDIDGDTWLGVEGNGWTNLLWIAGGGLLAFGSGFHWGAKSMAFLVGLAFAAAAIIAIFDGGTSFEDGDVFGIFAANDLTMLLWGAAAAYLLISSMLPRVGGRPTREEQLRETRDEERPTPPAATERTTHEADGTETHREPMAHGGERTETHREPDAATEHPERPATDEPRSDGGRFDRDDAATERQAEATRAGERGDGR